MARRVAITGVGYTAFSSVIGILHLLEEVDPEDVRIGMPVRAVWKTPAEREGAITDIRYFRPDETGA